MNAPKSEYTEDATKRTENEVAEKRKSKNQMISPIQLNLCLFPC